MHEPLMLQLRAMVQGPGLWKWPAHVPLEIDGRKQKIEIRPGNEPTFAVVGEKTPLPEFMWHDSRWATHGDIAREG